MFNFTNQKPGSVAGLGVQSGMVRPVVVNNTVDGKGVEYWATKAILLTKEVEKLVDENNEAIKIAVERRANDAGLRAVIRDLLNVIRKQNPDNRLLLKENRDKVFKEFRDEELKKALNGGEMWEPLERPAENQSP